MLKVMKVYKRLNLSTHKIIESADVKIDKFAKKSEEESNKELKITKALYIMNYIHCLIQILVRHLQLPSHPNL